jgi:hypothetical protein
MSAALAQPAAIPVGTIKQFGPYGPEYEVLGPAEPENGEDMVNIVTVRTGEELTYQLGAVFADPEAGTCTHSV